MSWRAPLGRAVLVGARVVVVDVVFPVPLPALCFLADSCLFIVPAAGTAPFITS